jgi:hypothetical protein
VLDLPGIEARRAEIENSILMSVEEGAVLDHDTHTARRQAERALYWTEGITHHERPTTSHIRCNADNVSEEHFGRMQTDAELFVAAKESSFDWLTSYDCLGRVEHGYTADVPPETAHGPDDVIPAGDGAPSDGGGGEGAPKPNGDGAKPDNGKGKAKCNGSGLVRTTL